jgi:hypothetical protein
MPIWRSAPVHWASLCLEQGHKRLKISQLNIGDRPANNKGMTPEKKTFLLGQLQEAIDEAVSESGRINAVIGEMKRCGFDLCLILESTVTITPSEDHQSDAVPEPSRDRDSDRTLTSEISLTEQDLEFLQELNIAA